MYDQLNKAFDRGALRQITTVLDVAEQQVDEHVVDLGHVEVVEDFGPAAEKLHMLSPEGNLRVKTLIVDEEHGHDLFVDLLGNVFGEDEVVTTDAVGVFDAFAHGNLGPLLDC